MGNRGRTSWSRISTTTRCCASTVAWSSCASTTSARWCTTGRAGSGRMRSSGATRRSRWAPLWRSPTRTGSFPPTASRRSASCAGCRRRRCCRGGGATRPAGGTRGSSGSPRSRCRSRRTSPTRSATRGARSSRGRATARSPTSATAPPPRAPSTRARTSQRSCVPRSFFSATTTSWAISTPLSDQTRAESLADKAVGYGMPGVRVDGGDVLAVHQATVEALVAGARGRGPDVHRGPHVPRRSARHRGRPERVLGRRAGRGGTAERVPRPLRGLPAAARPARRTTSPRRSGPRRSRRCAPGSPRPRPSPAPDPEAVFAHAYVRSAARATATAERSAVAEKTLVEAVNEALHVEMERDGEVMVMGEDVGRAGGVFRATAGLRERFGADRCVDTPLAEAGILGDRGRLWHGRAGGRSARCSTTSFSYPCLDQLITHVGRYRWRTGGAMEFPLTIRMPDGGGVKRPRAARGLARGLLRAHAGDQGRDPVDTRRRQGAARRGDPRPRPGRRPRAEGRSTATLRGEVPEGEHVVPLGQARIAREGSDVTLVAYGAMVGRAWAPRTLLDASAEVVDVRTLKPLDEEAILGLGGQDGARRDRAGGAARRGLRRRDRRRDRREGDPRPAGPDRAGDRLRRPLPLLVDSSTSTCRRRSESPRPPGGKAPCLSGRIVSVAYEFKLPDLGEGVAEGEIAAGSSRSGR